MSNHQEEHVYFHTLFKVFFIPLVLHAKFFLNDEDLAKDIVQEVFMHLWEKRESFKFDKNSKSYLYKAVQHKCINYLNHVKVEG